MGYYSGTVAAGFVLLRAATDWGATWPSRPPSSAPAPGWAAWCRACRRAAEKGWAKSVATRASGQWWCRRRQPLRPWCTGRPSGSCAAAPAPLWGRGAWGGPSSSCRPSCRRWRRGECARGCSGLCWSTNQLWPLKWTTSRFILCSVREEKRRLYSTNKEAWVLLPLLEARVGV